MKPWKEKLKGLEMHKNRKGKCKKQLKHLNENKLNFTQKNLIYHLNTKIVN